MITEFHRWHKHYKITLFFAILILFALTSYLLFISPIYEKIHRLQAQKIILNSQWQQRHSEAVHYKQLQQDILLLQYPYLIRLHALQKPMTAAELYTQISLLAKTHCLQIMALKPQKNQPIAGLNQLTFNLDMSGAELKLLSFLQLLMHQPWLLEIQQLTLSPTANGIHLQTTLAAYYAPQ